MSAGKAKRMLIHTKQGDEWTTREFLSIADAKRYLRANGTKFKDEYAFYTQDFGTIVNDDKLIEIEEAFENEEKFEFFGKIYIPLSSWCLKNGIDYKTGISLSASKKINTCGSTDSQYAISKLSIRWQTKAPPCSTLSTAR